MLAWEEAVPLDLALQMYRYAGLGAAEDRRYGWMEVCPQGCQAVPRGARMPPWVSGSPSR